MGEMKIPRFRVEKTGVRLSEHPIETKFGKKLKTSKGKDLKEFKKTTFGKGKEGKVVERGDSKIKLESFSWSESSRKYNSYLDKLHKHISKLKGSEEAEELVNQLEKLEELYIRFNNDNRSFIGKRFEDILKTRDAQKAVKEVEKLIKAIKKMQARKLKIYERSLKSVSVK